MSIALSDTRYLIKTPRTELVWDGKEAAHLRQIVVYKEVKKRTPTEEPVFSIFKNFSFFTRARSKKEGTDEQMSALKKRIDQRISVEDQNCVLTHNQSFSDNAFAEDIIRKSLVSDQEYDVRYCRERDPELESVFGIPSDFFEIKT